MAAEPERPSPESIAKLATWAAEHSIIKEQYALGGGAWLVLRRIPGARPTKDADLFSTREDVSSYKAMMEIIHTCKTSGIPYTVLRRGEHYCQVLVRYPDPDVPIKIDIGKIWRPFTPVFDPALGYNVLPPQEMVSEKLQCVVDRIEPTDLYDLCVLHEQFPAEFDKALTRLIASMEANALLVYINRCLETEVGPAGKVRLTRAHRRWMETAVPKLVRAVTKAGREELGAVDGRIRSSLRREDIHE